MKRVIILLLVFMGIINANEIKDKTEEMLKLFFGDKISTGMEEYFIPIDIKTKIELECRQKFFRDSVYLWKIFEGTELKGYAILDNVYGKSLPITFMVIFDTGGKILKSSIIKYREPYGGGVQNETWQAQFEGKDMKSSFQIGEDIDAVSGATISGRSVTAGIKKLSILISIIAGDK